jgi:hypothetical protein
MLKWIYENKKFDYIFKTDDDIKFNFEKLKEIYNYISYNNIKYAGRLVSTNFHLSAYHKDKCETEIKNYLFPIQKTQYCAGGGYFINKDVVELIVKNFEDQYIIMNKEIYEDYFIGRFLNKQGIFPVGVNIQNQACFW